MNTNTYVPRHQWSPPSLVPDEPPAPPDDEMMVEDEELAETEEEIRQLPPHTFAQYCEHSRHVARLRGFRPSYIGYAFIPQKPQGVCHYPR
jgi:hypothetical protein